MYIQLVNDNVQRVYCHYIFPQFIHHLINHNILDVNILCRVKWIRTQ